MRLEDRIVRGQIDRLVLRRDREGRVAGARVLDFKTDAVDDEAALDARVEHYRPQLDAYRAAVRRRHGLKAGSVEAALVFLKAGGVREL